MLPQDSIICISVKHLVPFLQYVLLCRHSRIFVIYYRFCVRIKILYIDLATQSPQFSLYFIKTKCKKQQEIKNWLLRVTVPMVTKAKDGP